MATGPGQGRSSPGSTCHPGHGRVPIPVRSLLEGALASSSPLLAPRTRSSPGPLLSARAPVRPPGGILERSPPWKGSLALAPPLPALAEWEFLWTACCFFLAVYLALSPFTFLQKVGSCCPWGPVAGHTDLCAEPGVWKKQAPQISALCVWKTEPLRWHLARPSFGHPLMSWKGTLRPREGPLGQISRDPAGRCGVRIIASMSKAIPSPSFLRVSLWQIFFFQV